MLTVLTDNRNPYYKEIVKYSKQNNIVKLMLLPTDDYRILTTESDTAISLAIMGEKNTDRAERNEHILYTLLEFLINNGKCNSQIYLRNKKGKMPENLFYDKFKNNNVPWLVLSQPQTQQW